jgi:anti-anti-sigma regulatory factor
VIWKVLFPVEREVILPRSFNADTMRSFLENIVDEQRDAKCSKVTFDFKHLNFVEPVGVVVLSNVIEYFKALGCKISFRNHSTPTTGTVFLDDSLFFERYLKKRLFNGALRSTTIPLMHIHSAHAHQFLHETLMPWVGREVGLLPTSIDSLRVSLEEILHNIKDHSGVNIGCTFAQHFPNRNRIQIAVSDFGDGIPTVVRTKRVPRSRTRRSVSIRVWRRCGAYSRSPSPSTARIPTRR